MVLGLVVSLFLSPWLAAGMVGFTAIRLARLGRVPQLLASVPAALALPAFAAVTLIVSLASANIVGIAASIGIAGLSVSALHVRVTMTRPLFEKVVDAAGIASLYGLMAIVLQRLNGPASPEFRAASVFLNANYYAAAAELVFLMSFYRLAQPGRTRRWRHAALAAANAAGIWLSGSRGGILAAAAGLLAFLAFSHRRRLLPVLAALSAAVFTSAAMAPSLLPRFDSFGPDLLNRMAIWRAALLGFLQNPLFGFGTQAYRLVYGQFGGPPTAHAHSLFLDPLLSYGLVGVTLLGCYLLENIRAIRRLREAACDHSRLRLMAAIAVSILVHGLMDIAIGSLQTALLVIILLGSAGLTEGREQHCPARSWSGTAWQGRKLPRPRRARPPEPQTVSIRPALNPSTRQQFRQSRHTGNGPPGR